MAPYQADITLLILHRHIAPHTLGKTLTTSKPW